MVILPVGCMEMHGPDVPLGCDSFHAWAQAILLAEVWKCVALPPVFYAFPGASGPWPGTVDITVKATQEYITAIIHSLLKNGFKRIVLCGTHGPLQFILEGVIRDVFQETGNVVLHIRPKVMPEDLMKKELGYIRDEDILVLASLKLLGLHGAYDPRTKVNKPKEFSFKSMSKLKEHNASMPWTFSRDYQHTGLRKQVKFEHADKAIDVMKKAVKREKDFPKHFAQYQKDMKKLYQLKPWKKSTVWTKTK